MANFLDSMTNQRPTDERKRTAVTELWHSQQSYTESYPKQIPSLGTENHRRGQRRFQQTVSLGTENHRRATRWFQTRTWHNLNDIQLENNLKYTK